MSTTVAQPAAVRPPATDRTASLLWHGYDFAARVRAGAGRRADPDAVPLRVLGRPAVLLRGPEGVRLFTDTGVVSRQDATPRVVAEPLFGRGAVHGLDDDRHRHRKALFVEVMRRERVSELVRSVDLAWQERVAGWRTGDHALVEATAVSVIGRTVLAWGGIPLPDGDADRVADDLATIVDGFAVPGPAYLRALAARRRTDRWATAQVERMRQGRTDAAAGTALEVASRWTELDGALLPARVAAVELQNVLRPTVAVSRFASFAALALAQHGQWAPRIRADCDAALAFAHEVRRLTPFVPVLAGITRCDVVHRGRTVPRGTRLLLDVVGTNRDARHWPDPLAFDPTRFLPGSGWEPDALVPQGGGEVAAGHRCPGEDTTLGLIATTAAALAATSWWLPPQDLTVSSRRMPTRPASGVRLVVR